MASATASSMLDLAMAEHSTAAFGVVMDAVELAITDERTRAAIVGMIRNYGIACRADAWLAALEMAKSLSELRAKTTVFQPAAPAKDFS